MRSAGFFHEAHAAMHLNADASDFVADVGGESFRHRRQQCAARSRFLTDLRIGGAMRHVDGHGCCVADGARSRRHAAHQHQVTLDVRIHDDRIGAGVLAAKRLALLALLRIGQRALIGTVGKANTLQADAEACLIHHGEHRGHAAVFLADEIGDGAALVAHGHGAGR